MSIHRSSIRSFLLLCSLSFSSSTLSSACAGDDLAAASNGFPEAPLASLPSDGNALRVEARTSPTQPPSRGEVSVEYRVTDKTGAPVDGLTLEVTPWMPSMGHGASVRPQTSPQGDGRYLVTGVSLFMAGRWELRARFSGPVQDTCTVAFDVP